MNNYEKYKNILLSYGIKLLTKENEYKNTAQISTFECEKGHQWNAKLSNVLDKKRISRKSKGCPSCADEISLEQSLINAQKNLLPSHKIISSFLKSYGKVTKERHYIVECSNNHKYEKRGGKLKEGCPECSKKTYVGQERVRLMFETEFNKSFPTLRPDWLKNPATGRNLELDGYCDELKLAFEYQGRQHDSNDTEFGGDYENQKARDDFKVKACATHGIKLITITQPRSYEQDKFFASIVTQAALQEVDFTSVLSQVDFNLINDMNSLKKNYEVFKDYVEEKGYQLLSDSLTTMEDLLDFQCKGNHKFSMKGSTFKTMLNTTKYRDEPCLECHSIHSPEKIKEIITLETCQDFAQSIGYECLSKEYQNVTALMDWKCSQGHIFSKNYRSFQRSKTNHYCLECETSQVYEKQVNINPTQYKSFDKSIVSKGIDGKVKDLNWLQNFAKENNVELMSNKYLGVDYSHQFKCEKGHVFENTVSNLMRKISRKSLFCSHTECTQKKEINLTYCQDFATDNNLICLSTQYKNVNELMNWKCSQGHTFKKSFRQFQRNKTGSYCPECHK